VPIGACLAKGKAAEILTPGSHGSTFGGNPLACAAALAVVETLEKEQLAMRAQFLGEKLLTAFADSLAGVVGVEEIRGLGLLIGLELDRPCAELVGKALERGLLINVTAENVIRLLPPLVMTDEQTGQLVETLSELIKEFLSQG